MSSVPPAAAARRAAGLAGALALAGLMCLPLGARAQVAMCSNHLVTIEPDGRVSAGSMDALLAAFDAGAEMRVGWWLDWDNDREPDIAHWADAAFLSRLGDNVYAQVSPIHGQVPNVDDDELNLSAEPIHWYGLLGSDGTLEGRFDISPLQRWDVRSIWCRKSGT